MQSTIAADAADRQASGHTLDVRRPDAHPCHGSVTVANATALAAAVATTSAKAPCVVLLSAHEYNLTDELELKRSVTVRAAVSGDEAVLRAAKASRVLSVGEGVDVTLEGVRVSGGWVRGANGGGILNCGNLTLIGCVVVANRADGSHSEVRRLLPSGSAKHALSASACAARSAGFGRRDVEQRHRGAAQRDHRQQYRRRRAPPAERAVWHPPP